MAKNLETLNYRAEIILEIGKLRHLWDKPNPEYETIHKVLLNLRIFKPTYRFKVAEPYIAQYVEVLKKLKDILR